ncbi:MAG: urate hydroxylase PuuD [Bacteriovoracaceae bacterium]|nr:urate hydroxylase PuuD [Bacteriovoracaceae bacterium]
MDIALFSADGLQFLFRWIHFLAGVAWIGILYYFNFVQGEYMKEADAQAKASVVTKLLPRALWWFRFGALFTFISGVAMLESKARMGGWGIFATSWGIFILTGAGLGTLMFLNVWLVIWPNQKIVMASAEQVAKGGQPLPQAAISAVKAGLASRHNTLFSIPMLFFMGAASHLPLIVNMDFSALNLFLVLAFVIGLLQLNAIKGKLGPIASIKGVIHFGILLTVVLYGLIEFLT